jgi:hypothetical protein
VTWSGDASGNDLTASIVMNAEKTVSATFTQGSSIIAPGMKIIGNTVYSRHTGNQVRITLALTATQEVTVSLYTSQGRKIRAGAELALNAGSHTVNLNTRGIPLGTYYIRIKSGKTAHILPLTIIRND